MYNKGHKRMLSIFDENRESYGLSLYEDKRDNVILSSEVGTSDFVKFAHKKAEKHVAVSYMLTNFLTDTEPLKWHLREATLSFLSDIYVLHSSKQLGVYGLMNALSSIDEMRSLYRIMRTAGHISQMNSDFIEAELNEIRSVVRKRIDTLEPAQSVIIDEAVFNTEVKVEKNQNIVKDKVLYKGHESLQHTEMSDRVDDKKTQPTARKIVPENKVNKVEFSKKLKQQSAYRMNLSAGSTKAGDAGRKSNKEARRESILLILKEQGELTIKDIAVAISGCSEKTVQRELGVLIKDNIIKREGERRWSKYSLV